MAKFSDIPSELIPPSVTTDNQLWNSMAKEFTLNEVLYRYDNVEYVGHELELDRGPCGVVNVQIERFIDYIKECEDNNENWDISIFFKNLKGYRNIFVWFESSVPTLYNGTILNTDIIFIKYKESTSFGFAMSETFEGVEFFITSPVIIGVLDLGNNYKKLLYRLSPNINTMPEDYKAVTARRIIIGKKRNLDDFNRRIRSAFIELMELATNDENEIIYRREQ